MKADGAPKESKQQREKRPTQPGNGKLPPPGPKQGNSRAPPDGSQRSSSRSPNNLNRTEPQRGRSGPQPEGKPTERRDNLDATEPKQELSPQRINQKLSPANGSAVKRDIQGSNGQPAKSPQKSPQTRIPAPDQQRPKPSGSQQRSNQGKQTGAGNVQYQSNNGAVPPAGRPGQPASSQQPEGRQPNLERQMQPSHGNQNAMAGRPGQQQPVQRQGSLGRNPPVPPKPAGIAMSGKRKSCLYHNINMELILKKV